MLCELRYKLDISEIVIFQKASSLELRGCFFSISLTQAYNIPGSPPPTSGQRSLSVSDNQDEPEEKLSKTNLYIRGLSPGTTDEDLNNLCSR